MTDTLRGTLPGPSAHRRLQDLLHDDGAPLVVGEVLGQGSNGVVCLALQRRVGREVAVKLPRYSHVDSLASVVQEGWVAGALEHPNIVPVYDIRVVDGRPAVVMKRVEGVPWLDLIRAPEVVRERYGAPDPLEWHLRTLLSVCRAVEYAHSRGVIHQDLKPANVMIGHYGEVWVLDWGSAVSLVDDEEALIPRAVDQSTATGTPAYMAPEQARGEGPKMTERTDVFCLGSVLYEVVSGQAPRRGTLESVLRAAGTQSVEVADDLPLSDVLRDALAFDPADRPPSVAAFRQRVEAWLERQGAQQLLVGAMERLAALDALAGREGADRVEVYDRFGAARFGLQQVLDAWPQHEGAREALRDAHLTMVDYELRQEDPRAARLHLAQLGDGAGDLSAWGDRVDALEAQQAEDQKVLARLRADDDPRTAWWARLLVCSALGTVWVLTPVGSMVMRLPQGFVRELFIAGGTFVLSLMVMAALWKYLVRSRLNRVLVVSVAAGPGLAFLLNVGGWLAGMDSQLSGTIELFCYFTVALFAALLGERWLIVGALGFLMAFFLSMALPGTTLLWMNLANVLMVINAVAIWAPMAWRQEPPSDRPWLGAAPGPRTVRRG